MTLLPISASVPIDQGSVAFLRFSTVNVSAIEEIVNDTDLLTVEVLERELEQLVH